MSFFFFKQKTAYEMRIRDWSSDVCSSDLEEGAALAPKFDADGLIPAVAADATDGTVLMLAWMNAAALAATIETGEARHWSRSRREMWRKGGRSGHVQRVREVRLDCDQDAVLLLVEPEGPGARSEEHTSELQSQMRISCAAFRLRTKAHVNRKDG